MISKRLQKDGGKMDDRESEWGQACNSAILSLRCQVPIVANARHLQ